MSSSVNPSSIGAPPAEPDAQRGGMFRGAWRDRLNFIVDMMREMSEAREELRPFVEEYKVKSSGNRVIVLGEGRLISLAAAEGHPASVMDMSFANQALSCEYLVTNKGKLTPGLLLLPEEVDMEIAALKLEAMHIKIDQLTPEMIEYMNTWEAGT